MLIKYWSIVQILTENSPANSSYAMNKDLASLSPNFVWNMQDKKWARNTKCLNKTRDTVQKLTVAEKIDASQLFALQQGKL